MTKRKKSKPIISISPTSKDGSISSVKEVVTLHSDTGFWPKNWWKALILLVLSVVIYYQCTNFGYVLDDQIVITDNSFTKKGFSGIGELFSTESMTGYFGEQKNLVEGNRYRPLSLVTFAVEIGLLGEMNPRVSHWVNIILYGLSAILLFRLFSLLFNNNDKTRPYNTWLAFGVAMLFVVHPIHVEAVANIKGRDEIMALLFSLATLYVGYKYAFNKKWLYLIIANILFFLGLLSKENTITFLAILPLTIYFFSKFGLVKSFFRSSSFLVTTILYLAMRFYISGVPKLGAASNDLMNNPFLEMDASEKFATILYTLVLYVKLLFIPFPLTHDYYPYAIPKMDFGDWQVWISLLLYAFIIIWAFMKLKSKNIASYAILFYLITLTIVSNIVINLGTFMNDRFVYMSSVGFCVLLIWTLSLLGQKLKGIGNKVAIGVFLAITMVYALVSFNRVPVWESALTLNQSAIVISKNSARANTFMSTALFEKGRVSNDPQERLAIMKEAFPYAEKSVEIHPSYYNGHLMYAGIASEIYKVDNNIDPFIYAFEKVMKVRPDIGYVTEYLNYLNERNTETVKLNALYHRVGQALISRNKSSDAKWAIHYLNMAYANNKNDKLTNTLLGQAYQLLGDDNNANRFLNAAQNIQ